MMPTKNLLIDSLNREDTLLIGIGNESRQDDGLGWAFVRAIHESGSFKGKVGLRYQLQIEEADHIRSFRQVIFVDATHEDLPEGFALEAVSSEGDLSFTTHRLSPSAVMALANDLYDHQPEAYILKIQGEQWEMEESMSPKAQKNLQKALNYLKGLW